MSATCAAAPGWRVAVAHTDGMVNYYPIITWNTYGQAAYVANGHIQLTPCIGGVDEELFYILPSSAHVAWKDGAWVRVEAPTR
jgi:hypothetical protein